MIFKLLFYKSEQSSWGQLQANISSQLRKCLESGKEFAVTFDWISQSKTAKQCAGIHKLCALYATRLSEFRGIKISMETAKESIKYRLGYLRLATEDECFREALSIRRKKELEEGERMTIKQFDFLVEKLQKTFQVPKSFADATKEEMLNLISGFGEFAQDNEWHEIKLNSADMNSLLESFNNSKSK